MLDFRTTLALQLMDLITTVLMTVLLLCTQENVGTKLLEVVADLRFELTYFEVQFDHTLRQVHYLV